MCYEVVAPWYLTTQNSCDQKKVQCWGILLWLGFSPSSKLLFQRRKFDSFKNLICFLKIFAFYLRAQLHNNILVKQQEDFHALWLVKIDWIYKSYLFFLPLKCHWNCTCYLCPIEWSCCSCICFWCIIWCFPLWMLFYFPF